MNQPSNDKTMRSKTYRVITGLIGLLFLGVAVFIVFSSEGPMGIGPIGASVVIAGLGLDALISALLNKESLLARIGPLP